ncbi:MAG: FecR family protein [Balneolaceae bacterium]|nr:MAG: FecR family protein [Balneolaceae bacterium]
MKQVYNWFKTGEGKVYFEDHLDRDICRYSNNDNLLLTPDVPSAKILSKIKQTRRSQSRYQSRNQSGWKVKIAVAAIICIALLSGTFIYQGSTTAHSMDDEITYRTFSTLDEQHRIISLSDGSQIRLNSNSSLRVPKNFISAKRHVILSGEAWFKIVSDQEKPFSVQTDDATIHVLGTEFNIKMDEAAGNIQIAVSEGVVAFESGNQIDNEGIRATLSRNNFALYYPGTEEIIIENTSVINYLSWIDGTLFFYDEPLWQISRTLARLYNYEFNFLDENVKQLTLSADLTRDELPELLSIISQTLNIDYEIDSSANEITWTSTKNQPLTNHSE